MLSRHTSVFQHFPVEHCVPITFHCNSQVVIVETLTRTKVSSENLMHLYIFKKALSMLITSTMTCQVYSIKENLVLGNMDDAVTIQWKGRYLLICNYLW